MKIIFSELIYCKIYTLLVIPYLREKAQFAKDDRKTLYADLIHCVPEFVQDYGRQEISDCTEAHHKLLIMRIGDLIAGTLDIFRVFCVAQNLDEWSVSASLGQMKRNIVYKAAKSAKNAEIRFNGSLYMAYSADGKIIMSMIDEGILRETLIQSGYAIADTGEK
ncbi:MAG: hypothetical protein LBC99_09000 [Spirochaetota bacterium]|jgi:hypothetical protein|nr:hypothetical protein [Spirochaetota bacterium]